MRCCHLLWAESELNCLSFLWAEVKIVAQKGNMRLAASGSCVSEQLLFSADTCHMPPCLEGQMWPRTSPWRLFSDSLGHQGSHNMEPRTNQSTEQREKKRGRQRMRGNHCFIINVSYNLTSFRMSSVNNLCKASPIDCE